MYTFKRSLSKGYTWRIDKLIKILNYCTIKCPELSLIRNSHITRWYITQTCSATHTNCNWKVRIGQRNRTRDFLTSTYLTFRKYVHAAISWFLNMHSSSHKRQSTRALSSRRKHSLLSLVTQCDLTRKLRKNNKSFVSNCRMHT